MATLTTEAKLALVQETMAVRRRLLSGDYIPVAERPLLRARLLELEQRQAAVEEAEKPAPPAPTIDGRISVATARARAKEIRSRPEFFRGGSYAVGPNGERFTPADHARLVKEHSEYMALAFPDEGGEGEGEADGEGEGTRAAASRFKSTYDIE